LNSEDALFSIFLVLDIHGIEKGQFHVLFLDNSGDPWSLSWMMRSYPLHARRCLFGIRLNNLDNLDGETLTW